MAQDLGQGLALIIEKCFLPLNGADREFCTSLPV